MRHICLLALLLSTFIPTTSTQAQGLPSRDAAMERMIVVVPMIGRGTPESPRRPLGTELISSLQTTPIGYRYVLSDDGRFAILELTARSFKHFDPLVNAFGAQATHSFNPRQHDRVTVELALKTLRKDFDLDSFLSGYRIQGVKP